MAKKAAPAPAKKPERPIPTIDPTTGIDLSLVQPGLVNEYLALLGLDVKGTPTERVHRLHARLALRAEKGLVAKCSCGSRFDCRFVRCPFCANTDACGTRGTAGEKDARAHIRAATPAAPSASAEAAAPAVGTTEGREQLGGAPTAPARGKRKKPIEPGPQLGLWEGR